ncbi:MAG: EAL domain-containing protein, partial [Sulfurimonas sp.]|nr:EAL domain-containing protein [Sulfurimonas sp.]
ALHSGNIIPYFQPIFNAKDNTIMKYEALARVLADDGEIILPHYFLNSAIEDNTFEFFTRQMLQKVFNIYSKVDVEISFNLTYDNISSDSMVSYIKNRLDKYGGDRITFEIVETEEIQDYAVLDAFIVMVKKYGAKVSIDDFGSGYSNFTNIIRLNVDFIKIDGSLIRELLSDGKARHMVEAIIIYSKNINVETIAEFVSSKELSDEVKRIGIDYIQGYYHGEPKSPGYYGLV